MWRAFFISTVLVLGCSSPLAGQKKGLENSRPFPVVRLGAGRRLDFIRMLCSEKELHPQRSWLHKVVDFVAGPPQWRQMLRPYDVITDSRGRVLVTDPGMAAVHIFDLASNKYTIIKGGKRDAFRSPIGIAVDRDDNIYVTDSQLGKVLVFNREGKYRAVIGDVAGEGYYKRPTGIAIDREHDRIYLTDTLRDSIYVTDLSGHILNSFGKRGTGPGEFNFPTQLRVRGDTLYVVDSMNFRVQAFDLDGHFRSSFGDVGQHAGGMFRPKGIGADRDGNLYLVDAAMECVQVFTPAGTLLYAFGRPGSRITEFQLPAGAFVDSDNRIFIADSYNHRIQIFQFVGPAQVSGGGQ